MDDKEMIESPHSWPGDVLCLKKRPLATGAGGYSAYGVIANARPPLVIYLRGPLLRDFEETKTYDTVDAMLADGWIVD